MTLRRLQTKALAQLGGRLPSVFRIEAAEVDAPHGLTGDHRSEVWRGFAVGLGFCAVFIVWALVSPLDAAASASGQVAVAGHRQTVQHRDGGVVRNIYVKDGQHVQAGQVLIDLAASEVMADERSLATQVIDLKAQRARLEAELSGADAIRWPDEFSTYDANDRALAQDSMLLQEQQYRSRRASVAAQARVFRQRQSEMAHQVEGYREQAAATARQKALMADQLAGTENLAKQGFAPTNNLRQLRRSVAALDGSAAEIAASMSSTQEQISGIGLQIIQNGRRYSEESSEELRDTLFRLTELEPKLLAAKDLLAKIQVRAPASGRVVGLSIFTPGGVIAPGQPLMDIVPDHAPLVIRASFMPSDVDGLRPGQVVEVKFTSFHERDLPIIRGELTNVSADSLTDPRTGQRFFTAEAMVPESEMARLAKVRGQQIGIRPGLPVQVMVPLHKRTAWAYMTEPLADALRNSFHER